MPHTTPQVDFVRHLSDNIRASLSFQDGDGEAAAILLERIPAQQRTLRQQLLLTQIYSSLNRFEDVLKICTSCQAMVKNQQELKRLLANMLLQAGAHFSETDQWESSFVCLGKAREFDPDNPALSQLPKDIEKALPLILHTAGDYRGAIRKILSQGVPENDQELHILAISSLSLLEQEDEMGVDEKIQLLKQAHSYWNALSGRTGYWRSQANRRQQIYNGKLDQEELLSILPLAGLSRCEAMLDGIEDQLKNQQRATVHHNFDQARTSMAIEKQSALLLEKICGNAGKQWPTGGFVYLGTLWGKEELDSRLEQFFSIDPGSDGWLLKGLAVPDEQLRGAYLQYATGAYAECFSNLNGQQNKELDEVGAQAVIRYAEESINANRYINWRPFAEKLVHVNNPKLRRKGEGLLDTLAAHQINVLRSQGRSDDILAMIIELLQTFPSLSEVKSKGSGVMLKHAEKCFFDNKHDECIENFRKAYEFSTDKSVCEKQLGKMIKHILNTNFETKNYSPVFKFIEKLTPHFGQLKIVRAQSHFARAMEAIDKYGIDSASAFNELEAAYNTDSSDGEIATIYSIALSGKGVGAINAIGSHSNRFTIESAVKKSENYLLQAIRVDPKNTKAKENLRQLFEMISKVPGLSLSNEALAVLIGFKR